MRLNSLSFPEEVLDQVAPLVDFGIDAPRPGAPRMLGMTTCAPRASNSSRIQSTSKALSAISPPKSTPLDQRRHAQGVEAVTRQQLEAHQVAERVGQGDDLRAPAAARAAYGLALSPPFAPCPVAVDLDDAAVDHRVLQVRVAGQSVEYAFENIGLDPMPEPLEHRVPSREHLGQVPPRAAGARDPQNGLEEKPRVSPSAPGVDLPRQCGSIRAHCASVSTNRVIDCSLLGA